MAEYEWPEGIPECCCGRDHQQTLDAGLSVDFKICQADLCSTARWSQIFNTNILFSCIILDDTSREEMFRAYLHNISNSISDTDLKVKCGLYEFNVYFDICRTSLKGPRASLAGTSGSSWTRPPPGQSRRQTWPHTSARPRHTRGSGPVSQVGTVTRRHVTQTSLKCTHA